MRIVETLLRAMVIGAGLRGRRRPSRSTAPSPSDAMACGAAGGDGDGGVPLRRALAEGRRTRQGRSLARIRRRKRPRAGAVEARPHVCRRRRRGAATISRRSNISAASPTRHAEDNPDTPQARFVANAFVALGHYYLDGIPKTRVKRDPERAREMFAYAASYFRDPDAQYYLARLYLDGVGAPHDPRQAARWFGLSAQKGQCSAQAMLGAMLFAGDHVPRQAARGLMWLTLAKDSARTTGPGLDRQALRQRLPAGDRGRARLGRCLSQALAGDAARVARAGDDGLPLRRCASRRPPRWASRLSPTSTAHFAAARSRRRVLRHRSRQRRDNAVSSGPTD